LFDKQIGKTLFAFNIVGENEWEAEVNKNDVEMESEMKSEIDFGISHSFNNLFSAGIELRNANVSKDGEVEASSLFAGPVFSYNAENWWTTLTILPQLMSFKEKTNGKLDLIEYERIETRLLFSFHL